MDLLKVDNLSVIDTFLNERIISNISFSLKVNTCLAIVGESGSGKSITCKAILDLLDPRLKVEGRIFLKGKEIKNNSSNSMMKIRGKKITMILQDMMTAFDPISTIGNQIKETLCENLEIEKKEAQAMALESLNKLDVYDAKNVLKKYPHQLSGGMLQRCMIAISMALKPDIIIADEPTTALDSIHKVDIINEFKLLQRITGTAIILVSHDLGIVQQLAQEVLVIKNGVCVEYGDMKKVLREPKNEYTKYLIETRLALSKPYNRIIREGFEC